MHTIVYHGGTEIVMQPLVDVGRSNLDFGPGFYVTDIRDQAANWALKMADIRGALPILCNYKLLKTELIANSRYKRFEHYDREWLDFICACRQQADMEISYDVIEGGIADDRVVNSVRMYINGYISADETLRRLRHYQPNNQICINQQELVDKYLIFESYQVLETYE